MEDTATIPWRPQAFGRRSAKDIADPLIEPLWRGDRVLVVSEGADVGIYDVDGAPVATDVEAIIGQLREAIMAGDTVIDGYLTHQATPAVGTVYLVGSEVPSMGQMTSQLLVGRGLANRAVTRSDTEETAEERENPLAFVAVDLISLDGEPLLDIPLLERKRLLESVLREADLVRRGAYIRPPVDTWLASWRTIGFRELAYKSANGRYLPGEMNDTWAIVRIPSN